MKKSFMIMDNTFKWYTKGDKFTIDFTRASVFGDYKELPDTIKVGMVTYSVQPQNKVVGEVQQYFPLTKERVKTKLFIVEFTTDVIKLQRSILSR